MTQDEESSKSSPPCSGGVSALRRRGGRSERIHNIPKFQTFRTQLRKNLTPAEAALWKVLKGSQLSGRKFRRQHSVGPYILDFFCVYERLGIELDGEVHFNEVAQEYDYERKLFLNEFGIKILRFENYLVFEELDFVLNRIESNFEWWKSG